MVGILRLRAGSRSEPATPLRMTAEQPDACLPCSRRGFRHPASSGARGRLRLRASALFALRETLTRGSWSGDGIGDGCAALAIVARQRDQQVFFAEAGTARC